LVPDRHAASAAATPVVAPAHTFHVHSYGTLSCS